ncbi:MAG: response regulator [Deltaproteobacteria bacterium]|nr:MAG: response regulator [Deltaproteobacteria bacterium]
MKILYAEDNLEIASLFLEILNENFPEFKVFHVDNGKKAIDYLQSDIFDLVISDYTMPEVNGGGVLNYMLDNNREEPFILITGEKIKLLPEFKGKTPTDKMKFLNKPVDEDVIVQTIARMLNLTDHLQEEGSSIPKDNDFIGIEISRITNLNSAPCDFYLRLNESKMIKVINRNGIELQDIVNKYDSKGVSKLYVVQSDLEDFNNSLTKRIEIALDSKEELSTNSRVALAGDAIITVQENLLNFGIKEDFVNHANKIVDHVLATYSMDTGMNNLIKMIQTANDGYFLQHSMLTSFLSNIILRNSEWNSVSNQEKITMASLFHDISLKNGEHEDWESKSFLMGINKDNENIPKDFLDHPQRTVELLSKVPNMPDLFTIILEHHEKPDGTGFPRGLKANRLSPMSCILIMSHHLSDLIAFKHGEAKLDDEMLSTLDTIYKDGHFVQLLSSLKLAI